jgi:hypothetical protein
MSTVLRSRLKLLLGVGAILGIVLFSQPPSVGAGVMGEDQGPQPVAGPCGAPEPQGYDGVYYVRCGTYCWMYQNNAFAGPCPG